MTNSERDAFNVLMASLAHELNTPLGAIQSNRDVLQRAVGRLTDIVADDAVDEAEVEQIRDLMETIREVIEIDQVAVDLIGDLVKGVRNCWRADDAHRRCVDLHEGLDSTVLLLGHVLKHRIDLIKDYGELPAVECYPGQVNQIFMNLLLNASQAIPDKGTITIRTRRTGDRVSVEISDSGAGIPPEDLERIFEPGYTTKGNRSGMGLGLGICRDIVEGQGGTIEVESQVGKGSTFRVLLPVRPSGG